MRARLLFADFVVPQVEAGQGHRHLGHPQGLAPRALLADFRAGAGGDQLQFARVAERHFVVGRPGRVQAGIPEPARAHVEHTVAYVGNDAAPVAKFQGATLATLQRFHQNHQHRVVAARQHLFGGQTGVLEGLQRTALVGHVLNAEKAGELENQGARAGFQCFQLNAANSFQGIVGVDGRLYAVAVDARGRAGRVPRREGKRCPHIVVLPPFLQLCLAHQNGFRAARVSHQIKNSQTPTEKAGVKIGLGGRLHEVQQNSHRMRAVEVAQAGLPALDQLKRILRPAAPGTDLLQPLGGGVVGEAEIGAGEGFGENGRAGEQCQLPALHLVGREHQYVALAFEHRARDAAFQGFQKYQPPVTQGEANSVVPQENIADAEAERRIEPELLQPLQQHRAFPTCRRRRGGERSHQKKYEQQLPHRFDCRTAPPLMQVQCRSRLSLLPSFRCGPGTTRTLFSLGRLSYFCC